MDREDILKEILLVLKDDGGNTRWNHLDEVYPGIYIGGDFAATDIGTLERLGMTHIMNVAYTKTKTHFFNFGTVNTDEEWYARRNFKCEFLGFEAIDYPTFDLSQFFDEGAEFIEKALSSKGKILVHCYVGMSRSATLVIAYLMMKQNMKAKDAIAYIRKHRLVHPNNGFLNQIVDLELKLQASCICKTVQHNKCQ